MDPAEYLAFIPLLIYGIAIAITRRIELVYVLFGAWLLSLIGRV
jgi:hypothetical protein